LTSWGIGTTSYSQRTLLMGERDMGGKEVMLLKGREYAP
jgi:hypothetical protein